MTISRTLGGKLGVYDGRVRLSADGDPKRFDWQGTGPNGASIQMAGVYEVSAGKLRLCYRVVPVGEAVARPGWADVLSKGVVCVEFEPAR
ncbi:MAG: hypothetical protein ACRC33_14790 [Gemmataceae bacterium]